MNTVLRADDVRIDPSRITRIIQNSHLSKSVIKTRNASKRSRTIMILLVSRRKHEIPLDWNESFSFKLAGRVNAEISKDVQVSRIIENRNFGHGGKSAFVAIRLDVPFLRGSALLRAVSCG